MARSVYVASAQAESGKSLVALGVLDALLRRAGRVAVFRPVVRSGRPDRLLDLLVSRLPSQAVTGASGTTYEHVHDDPAGAITTIVERYRAVEREADVVLVVGTDYTDVGAGTEFAFNAQVALNLGAPVLLVVNARGRTPQDVAAAVEVEQAAMGAHGVPLVGTVVNRADPGDLATLHAQLDRRGAVEVLPEMPLLAAPTVSQVVDAVDGRLVGAHGTLTPPQRAVQDDDEVGERLAGEVEGYVVAAMTLPRVLEYLTPGALVIVPGDRSDMLVGVLMAHRSQTFPRLAGLLLTGGSRPEPLVQRLVDGLATHLPIVSTPLNTFEAATVAAATHGALTDRSTRKIEAALETFAAHVDADRLLERLDVTRSHAVTPVMFEHDLVERARGDRRRIVLPEGTEPRVLRAAEAVLRRGIADVVLLGDADEVAEAAALAHVDLAGATVLDPCEPDLREAMAAEYARRRAHKGVTLEHARDVVVDVSYAGTMMVVLGMADGMVSGAAHTTAHTIRPAFEVIGRAPGMSVVSSVFFMCLADRVLVYGDCAVNPDPTAEQLADIAISSATTASAFGVDPRVAMLSYSTGTSGAGEDVEKVRRATELARTKAPDVLLEGPIQYDAAIDAGVASTKLPDSSVAGRATVFVFPDLNTGNNTYKAVQRSAGAVAVGPVLQGLRMPVNDLSRGATVRDIVTTVAITAVQAQLQSASPATESVA